MFMFLVLILLKANSIFDLMKIYETLILSIELNEFTFK